MKISDINLKIIKDSRGEDTLEAVMSSSDLSSVSSVPSGKSKGKNEVISVGPAVCLRKFENIKNEILNSDFSDILAFDNFLKKLDGTLNKSSLGGNLILVLSICFTKLFAKVNNLQTYQLVAKILGKNLNKFPFLFFNLIGGGLHAKDSLPLQEYILVTKSGSPVKDLSFAESMVEKLRNDIGQNYGGIRLGDEGTFSVKSTDPELGLEIIKRNLETNSANFALDAAASTFYSNGKYKIGEKILGSDQMLDFYQNLINKFPLISIEDPFSEDDRKSFSKLYELAKDKIWIIGDDLTVTDKSLIQKAVWEKLITGVIIKPNQIGSVSETLEAIKLAQDNDLKIIVSHRSGETNDDFIADLAFGAGADGLKSGAPTQPQRLAKYNRLIEIETRLNLL